MKGKKASERGLEASNGHDANGLEARGIGQIVAVQGGLRQKLLLRGLSEGSVVDNAALLETINVLLKIMKGKVKFLEKIGILKSSTRKDQVQSWTLYEIEHREMTGLYKLKEKMPMEIYKGEEDSAT
jgi:hypothetical protein